MESCWFERQLCLRVHFFRRERTWTCQSRRDGARRYVDCCLWSTYAAELSVSEPGDAETGYLQVWRRVGTARPIVRAIEPESRRQAAGADFPSRWADAADAARLALHVLLLELLRDEPVFGQSGVCGAGAELPQRNRLWQSVS